MKGDNGEIKEKRSESAEGRFCMGGEKLVSYYVGKKKYCFVSEVVMRV